MSDVRVNTWMACRAVGVSVAALAALGAVAGVLAPPGIDVLADAPATVDDVIGAAAALAIWALLAWVATSLVLSVLATVPDVCGPVVVRCAEVVAPRLLRRLIAVAIGVAVAGGAAPALAATSRGPAGVPAAVASVPTKSFSPAAITTGPALFAGGDHLPIPVLDRPASSGVVVVAPGDCLWSIAARHLGPTATTSDIAREWRRWYDVNRLVIGPDPDLILPGQRLTSPA